MLATVLPAEALSDRRLLDLLSGGREFADPRRGAAEPAVHSLFSAR